jgi:hypothetical protein
MKTKFILTMLSAATLLASASASHAQSKSQAGGLPELANEVAALRALVHSLQDQISGSGNPYAGTYTITTHETGLHGCGIQSVGPGNPQYLPRQAGSSVSVTSTIFDAVSNGSVLAVPQFDTFTQELRLSGIFSAGSDIEVPRQIDISPTGSMEEDVANGNALFSGQFSDDGSLFTAVVVGYEADTDGPGPLCDDSWTVHLTGVRK